MNRPVVKMSQSEYIIWKCETREDIIEKHPHWNSWQVEYFLNALEVVNGIRVVK